MGALLSFLSGGNESVDIDLNFEGSTPSEAELSTYKEVADVLNKSGSILEQLKAYAGCERYIKEAITSPTPENEENAMKAVLPAVDQLKTFYDFANELQDTFPKLLSSLCKEDPKAGLSHQQALAKQMGDVIDFVLQFDDLKMTNPAIQNDFSYYRRSLNRLKMAKGGKDAANLTIKDELANKMSLFFAYPTPMMNVINDCTQKYMNDNPAFKENVTVGLGLIANICQNQISNGKYSNEKTNKFVLRTMVGAIILYDHLHPQGAFYKKSAVNIRECITTLKSFKPAMDGLLNALRFTTQHLNDPDTPSNVKSLLE